MRFTLPKKSPAPFPKIPKPVTNLLPSCAKPTARIASSTPVRLAPIAVTADAKPPKPNIGGNIEESLDLAVAGGATTGTELFSLIFSSISSCDCFIKANSLLIPDATPARPAAILS